MVVLIRSTGKGLDFIRSLPRSEVHSYTDFLLTFIMEATSSMVKIVCSMALTPVAYQTVQPNSVTLPTSTTTACCPACKQPRPFYVPGAKSCRAYLCKHHPRPLPYTVGLAFGLP